MTVRERDIHLGDLDLNLLVSLHALIETSSVTQAAKQVGVTQSAMSHILRRLRATFGDKLLVRGQGGMVRTPRAEAMREPLYRGLLALQDTLAAQERFVPEESDRSFHIVATDYMQLTFAPQLARLVAREAPRVRLEINIIGGDSEELMDRLISGECDLIIGGPILRPPPEVMRKVLLEDRLRCAVRRGHPKVRDQRVSLDDYCALTHVLSSPTGTGPGVVDLELAALGRERHIAVRVQNFLSAPWLLLDADHILTAPARILSLYATPLGLHVCDPPAELPAFHFPIQALWSQHNDANPAVTWLRDLVERAGREPPPPLATGDPRAREPDPQVSPP